MRSCPHCHTPTEYGAHYCGGCGRLVAEHESQAPTWADEVQSLPHGAIDLPPTGDLIGREIIGQYVIRRKLGAGGMGEVYLADQPVIGRAVAIKVLHPHLTRGSETGKRFAQEAQAAARLQSPHIVQIFNFGDMGDGTLFMAMELLAGRTLAELIRHEAPLDPRRAVKIARQCCEALAEAHGAGVVHRDLKPSNLMLVQRGQDPEFVKVLDFGVAKLDGGEMTRDGALLGTPQYMSPEQLRSEEIDGRSDIYALGVILYEMLAGRPPFEARTPVGYVNMHLNEAPMPIAARVPGVPPALADALMRSLDKRPEARPQSAAELSQLLEAAVSGTALAPPTWQPSSSSSVAMTDPGTGAMAASIPAALDSPAPVTPAAPRSSAALWVILAVAIVSVLGGAATLGYLHLADQKREAAERLAALEQEVAAQRNANASNGGSDTGAGPVEAVVSGPPPPSQRDVAPPDSPPDPTIVTPVPSDDAKLPDTPKPKPKHTRPRGDLSPETEELMALSIAELEAKLDKKLDASLIPPSARKQVREAYELQKRMTPGGEQGDSQIKYTLIQYINAYDNPSVKAKRGDKLPLSELEQVFMTMAMKNDLAPDIRKQVLTQALASYDDYQHPEDIEFLKKIALAAMIRNMAEDPQIIDRKR